MEAMVSVPVWVVSVEETDVHMGSNPTRGSSLSFRNMTALCVLCYFALFVWPCLLFSTFLLISY